MRSISGPCTTASQSASSVSAEASGTAAGWRDSARRPPRATHSTTSTISRRTTVMLADAARAARAGAPTSPTAPIVSSAIIALGAARRLHADDALRDVSHCASPWRARSRSCRRTADRGCAGAAVSKAGVPMIGEAEMVGVELGLHAAGMRRQHQDAAADQQRLLDRMGDEEHREARPRPTAPSALPASCGASARRARRTARPSAAPPAPSRARARSRRAASCRPTACADRCSRSCVRFTLAMQRARVLGRLRARHAAVDQQREHARCRARSSTAAAGRIPGTPSCGRSPAARSACR